MGGFEGPLGVVDSGVAQDPDGLVGSQSLQLQEGEGGPDRPVGLSEGAVQEQFVGAAGLGEDPQPPDGGEVAARPGAGQRPSGAGVVGAGRPQRAGAQRVIGVGAVDGA
ncbi:hypothetical protein ACFWP1_18155, partial [Streptomyces sp. NPDC058425]|uniref:hypothetical protein n=1 Tax=Streptomyces sp. NPDC058425 TaxID=3346492 RepID=UPI00364A95A0